jgi:hypothetical protein
MINSARNLSATKICDELEMNHYQKMPEELWIW